MKEASYIIKKNEDDFINNWNQTRYIVYSVFQSQSTKHLTLEDVLKFPWEKEEEEEPKIKGRSKEELIKYAKEMEKIVNG